MRSVLIAADSRIDRDVPGLVGSGRDPRVLQLQLGRERLRQLASAAADDLAVEAPALTLPRSPCRTRKCWLKKTSVSRSNPSVTTSSWIVPLALLHASVGDDDDLDLDRCVLALLQVADRRELAPHVIAPRVVPEQVADRLQTEVSASASAVFAPTTVTGGCRARCPTCSRAALTSQRRSLDTDEEEIERLPTLDDGHVDLGVGVPQVRDEPGRQVRRRRRADDQRDQLAARPEQSVEDVARDVGDALRRSSASWVGAPSRCRRRASPRTSPGRQTPAMVSASRVAMVTPPWRVARAAPVIATTSSSKRAPASCTASAESTCTAAVVGTTATRMPSARAPSAAVCATGTRSRWCGRRTTSGAPVRRTASSSSPLDGRRPGGADTTSAPASSSSAVIPGPADTATTACPLRLPARLERTLGAGRWSPKWVTAIRCGRPARTPASIAAPTSSTCTCTFHSPSPPTTSSESPSVGELARRAATSSSAPRGGT